MKEVQMESMNSAPSEMNHKGDDMKLKEKLQTELERELEKSPDEMDTGKIDSILGLLNHLGECVPTEMQMSKEQFAEKYLKGVIKEKKNQIELRAAVIFLGIILCMSVCNVISVRATSKSLFHFVKEKAYLFCYETLGSRGREMDSTDIADNVQNLPEKIYESWEEMEDDNDMDFLIPMYIPDGFEALQIHMQRSEADDIGISRQYVKGEMHIRFLIRTVNEYGKMLYSEDVFAKQLEEEVINERNVSMYQTDGGLQAFFQDGKYIYVIDTNMDSGVLLKIIEEMR